MVEKAGAVGRVGSSGELAVASAGKMELVS